MDDPRTRIRQTQRARLAECLGVALESNPFVRERLGPLGFDPGRPPDLADLADLPTMAKSDIVRDQEARPPYGTNLTYPLERYTRAHRTSGTTGVPITWLDTPESWRWLVDCWVETLRVAGVTAADRVLVPFSFGLFIGFWAAFEATQRLGAMAVPGGGLSSRKRLQIIRDYEVTVLACTPTYALRLAAEAGVDAPASETAVRLTVHGGERGASIAAVRERIESSWGARCVDHAGATEVGAWGVSCEHDDHMHILEEEFVAEVLPARLDDAAADGDGQREPGAWSSQGAATPAGGRLGELVMTNLGRSGSPVVRYRTGDLVELVDGGCPCGRPTAYVRGGILGRVDEMLVVRGVNVYPAALEGVIRGFAEIDEFQVRLTTAREMTEIVIRIEVGGQRTAAVADALAGRIRDRFLVGARIECMAPGTLPRPAHKAQRFAID